ncbi:MAG: hypothetical protein NTY19_03990, partial [Planctomycetota bacterium]|nr:hypothetical protein [Planctomycetota bacterium]
GQQHHANSLPAEQTQVEPLYIDKHLNDVTSFVLDDLHEYEVRRAGQPAGRFRLHVKIAVDGTYYFQTDRGKLYFGKHEGTFYFYRVDGDDPHLRQLLLALPRLPLAYSNRLEWHDHVPLSVATTGVNRIAARLVAFVWPGLNGVQVTQRFQARNSIVTTVESRVLGLHTTAEVELDEQCGLAVVKVGEFEFRKTHITHWAVGD